LQSTATGTAVPESGVDSDSTNWNWFHTD